MSISITIGIFIVFILVAAYITIGVLSWNYLLKNNVGSAFPCIGTVMVKGAHFRLIYYILCGNPYLTLVAEDNKVHIVDNKTNLAYILLPVF